MTLRCRGFTLIELLITVTIFVFLIMLAGPMYGEFMANHQIRNATDALLNGVQEAQSAAVRSNTLARLLVDPATGTGGWKVFQTVDGTEQAAPVQVYTVLDGAPKVSITPVPGDARQVTFDGFGRIVANADASPTLTCLKVTNLNVSTPHSLNVAIGIGGLSGGTKLCDPAAGAGEPQACPAACKT
jgi:type IV fimbrial biogenesis protein FimT